MRFAEITKKILQNRDKGSGGKIVIVRFSKGHVLTFLVDDIPKPQIPGYPAQSLKYFDSAEEARTAIKELYKRIDYRPKHIEDLEGYYY